MWALTITSRASLLIVRSAGVGDRQWLYATTFELSSSSKSAPKLDLTFHGLDTYCAVYLVSLLLASQASLLVAEVANIEWRGDTHEQ